MCRSAPHFRLGIAMLIGAVVVARLAAAGPSRDSTDPEVPPPKSILVLHSFGRSVPFRSAFDASFEEALKNLATGPVDFFTETLDGSRFPGQNQAIVMRDYLQRRYAAHRPDVIVAVLDSAFDFLRRNRETLFPGVPIVYFLSRHPESTSAVPPATGIEVGATYSDTIGLALRLDPDVRHVIVIDASLDNSDTAQREITDQLKAFGDRMAVTFLGDLPLDEVVARLKNPPEHSIVLFSRQFLRTRDQTMGMLEGLAEVARASTVPIYGITESQIGQGVVGGYVLDNAANARTIAQMAMRIAGGMSPADLRPATAVRTPMLDWRELDKWKIPMDRLPANAVVQFQELTFWDNYKNYVLGLGSLLIAETMLIGGLMLQSARRRRAEQALGRSVTALRESSEQVRELAGRLIASQEDERRHVARELHDGLSQELALLTIEIDLLSQQSGELSPNVAERLRKIVAKAGDLSSSVHRLSHRLHPSQLEAVGLVSAVTALCRDMSRSHNLVIDFQHDQLPPDIDRDVRLCIYRVTQEALHNVVKHSGASRASVHLRRVDEEILLQIADPGVGFAVAERRKGLGLVSMRERVHFLNGRIVIHSHAGGGTRLGVRVPFSGRAGNSSSDHPAIAV